jgi:hypothetical protein
VRPARALAAALALGPALAVALEPRFDHRDTHGPAVETLVAYDAVARSGRPTASWWRPALRVAWGLDVSGEGDELLVGATLALGSPADPEATRVVAAADARYRAYFGVDQAKTFFDVGLWVPLRERLAAGPLVGIGAQYDLGRAGGIYLCGSFATAFGEARIASLALSLGAQLRFGLP